MDANGGCGAPQRWEDGCGGMLRWSGVVRGRSRSGGNVEGGLAGGRCVGVGDRCGKLCCGAGEVECPECLP